MASWVLWICLIAIATSIVKAQIDVNDCGISKGCFRHPADCTGANCELLASWLRNSDGSHTFQLSGIAQSYVAIGFSKSGGMMDSDVYACTMDLAVVRSRNGDGRNNTPQTLKGVSGETVSVVDSRIECTFTRQAASSDNDNTFYDLSGNNVYTVIMARSGFGLIDGNISPHDSNSRARSASTMNFNEFGAPPPTGPSVTENKMTTQLVVSDQEPLSLVGCNSTKGCFRYPPECNSVTTCSFFLSWTVEQDGNRFEMAGDVGTYVAVGFSKSGQMMDSDVYACTSNLELVRSRNVEANINDPNVPLQGVSDVAISAVDGKIRCSFTRKAYIPNDATFFDLREGNSYYIIMAKSGAPLANDGNIQRHWGGRVQGPKTSFRSAEPTAPMTGSGECGQTRGCFSSPTGCSEPECDFFVSWTKSGRDHIFTVSGDALTYVALGLSKSGRMADSDVYACTSRGEMVRSRNTNGNNNDANVELKGVSDLTVTAENGRIQCTFTRKDRIRDDPNYYDLSGDNMYTIIMAKSMGQLQDNGAIQIHSSRVFAMEAVNFNQFTSVSGAKDNKLLMQKAHGCLMIIAWLGFASIGITIARYFKSMSPSTMICDKKPIWFAVHRFCMVSAFLCTVAGFVIIFISVGGFIEQSQGGGVDTRFIHAILGTFVTFLAIINPIMALFRPHPGTKRRPIFNWAHWGVGITAHLGGKVTIFLALASVGMVSPLIQGLPHWLFWIMVVITAYHFINWMVFGCRMMKRKELVRRSDTMRMPPGGDGEYQEQNRMVKNMNDKTSNIMFLIYTISVTVVVAIFVIVIALI